MKLIITSVFLLLLAACNNSQPADEKAKKGDIPSAPSAKTNYLRMKINGQTWEADHELTGIVYPKGYNKAILIGGTKGPKDKYEQTFNINLYNCNGVGDYMVESGNKDLSAMQLGNLSETNYLYGNVLGFRMRVKITKATQNPVELEASFEGEMTGNTGDILKVTEGKFFYHE
jgi:hypothetical protein